MSDAFMGVAAMTPDAGHDQRPIDAAEVVASGAQRRLPSRWGSMPARREHGSAAEGVDATQAPAITSLAELEALGSPVDDGDDEGEGEGGVPTASEPKEARFTTAAEAASYCVDPEVKALDRSELSSRIALDLRERLAGLAEARAHGPLDDKTETERRMLAQVDGLVCLGATAVDAILAEPSMTPWDTWATVLLLSCLEGREALETIVSVVQGLGPDDQAHRRAAAEAFAASANPHDMALARACLEEEGTAPFGLELLSLRGRLAGPDLAAWAEQRHPETRAVVLRAMTRLVAPPLEVERFVSWLDTDDPALAWEAARALTLWGSGAPLGALRRGERLLRALGAAAVELLVLAGHHDDVALVQRFVSTLDPSPDLLDAVARLGHPGTWAYLAHHLGDPVLGEDAAAALTLLFGGDVVSAEERNDRFAWEAAIARLGLSPERRLRRGRDWSAAVVADECWHGDLSRRDIEARLDELRARIRVRVPSRLWAFGVGSKEVAREIRAQLR
ncbi:MAG: hypothetical protein AAGN82_32060 [Myxococcota bacterium]